MKSAEMYSKAAERAVLGYVLLHGSPHDLMECQRLGLDAEHFYFERHRLLWVWLLQRIELGLSVALDAVYEAAYLEDQARRFGGIEYLSGHADNPPMMVDEPVAQVVALSRMRRLFEYGRRVVASSKEPLRGRVLDAAAERLAGVQADLLALSSEAAPGSVSSADAGAAAVIAALDSDERGYAPTGLRNLDRYIDGLSGGELIILAGRSSMGKSVAAVTLALAAAQCGRVGYCSLEMSALDQHRRFISQLCGVPYRDMSRKGRQRLTPAARREVDRGAAIYSTLPIDVVDQGCYSLKDIEAYARRQAIQHRDSSAPLVGIVVDYLGLMAPDPGERRHIAAGRWVAGLKALAKELDIFVLALAQINRAAESLTDSVPRISNIADSTMLEATADVVLLTYRRGYYDQTADPTEVDFIIGKNRGGERGVVVPLSWHPPTGRHFDRS